MLRQLETIRAQQPVFSADAAFYAVDTGSENVLGVIRQREGEKLTGLFNFSEEPRTVCLAGKATDLLTGRDVDLARVELPGYGFLWALEKVSSQ